MIFDKLLESLDWIKEKKERFKEKLEDLIVTCKEEKDYLGGPC